VDPEWALFHLARALHDPVDPARVGSVEPGFQYRVNGEVYRFASVQNLKRFMETPTRWCGLLRDPVTGHRFEPRTDSPWAFWVGGPYYFESDSTKAVFIEDPHRYTVNRLM